jgi:hypothetical protein
VRAERPWPYALFARRPRHAAVSRIAGEGEPFVGEALIGLTSCRAARCSAWRLRGHSSRAASAPADEPTGNSTARAAKSLIQRLHQLHRDGLTIVL